LMVSEIYCNSNKKDLTMHHAYFIIVSR
jgi:hypothetical protein